MVEGGEMGWLGKVLGGSIGFALGGPMGGIAGAVFGHSFDIADAYMVENKEEVLSTDEQAQLTFFVAVFSMLAKLAQSDGTICEKEIKQVERFMVEVLQLNDESRETAISIFHKAIDSTDSFESFAKQFYEKFYSQPRFLEIIIEVMLQVSMADGTFCDSEETLILKAVSLFQMDHSQYNLIKSKFIPDTERFYAVLGCEPSDSDEFIKKQYRKLVSEYHPDKIASKGLPEEFTKFATDKFREIQEAYSVIKKERG